MSVVSKNLFDLLGNDVEGDSDNPSGPVKTVDKNTTRTTKRTVEPVAPAKPVNATSGARRGPGGNEGAFRDKNAGHSNNQRRGTEEAARGGPRGGRGARERGGRGGRYPRERDDRHSRTGPSGSEKQAAASWGAQEGEAEAKDEQAGEAIAKSELKEATAEDAQDAEIPEEEDKSVSYTEYLAQLAEKKLALGGGPDIRKANEGSKADKKWASAKPLVKEETDFVSATATKTKRERERKEKQILDIDQRYVEPSHPQGGRGGRGGARGEGGRGRGEGRGGRGRGEGRGGRGRGDNFRGAGEFRGGRGGRDNASINTKDESAFPSLGA
ncbi:hypothetical protein PG985_007138 [Apiospora marii]|uniref:Hyaluronan/mRNA-binding protein domain-containing protein n=1 Tax=Apiospora marii TaxID=335849 RepID=A0ABR1SEX6_9PEZI